MTQEEVNKILVEAEGGHWHEWGEHVLINGTPTTEKNGYVTWAPCIKCGLSDGTNNPDFSKWENFGRMLDIADTYCNDESPFWVALRATVRFCNRNDIPALISTDLTEVINKATINEAINNARCQICCNPIGKHGHVILAEEKGETFITNAYCEKHWQELGVHK